MWDAETPGFSVFDDDFLHGGMVMDVGRGRGNLLRHRFQQRAIPPNEMTGSFFLAGPFTGRFDPYQP